LTERYNRTGHDERDERDRLLRELLGGLGEGVVVRPPFRCDDGANTTIGAGTFVKLRLHDARYVAPIALGRACQLAPRVQLLTAGHPIGPELRRIGWEYGLPIAVGDNWLGGGAIVCPRVTIGEDTAVGAGAVVTRDLPAGVVALGVPARPVREIGDRDRIEVPDR
jgi:maltose O-acetyltransferase